MIIVVRKLTQEIITETLESEAEDNAFWLKLHEFASEIDIFVFDELQTKHVKESIEFNLLSGLDGLEKNSYRKFNIRNIDGGGDKDHWDHDGTAADIGVGEGGS